MQESTDMNMVTPAVEKPKASKGWMIVSIILIIILIGVCVFGGMIILKGDRDTNRLSEVESQLKEKEAKIEELEKSGEKINLPTIDIKALTKTDDFDFRKMEFTKDGKYLYVISDVTEEIGGYVGIWYKSTEEGSEWKKLQAGNGFTDCADVTDEQKQFMQDYKYIDDDLDSQFLGCLNADGTTFPE